MREIEVELEPSEYRTLDPKSGRWRGKLSKRWYRNWLLVCLGGLAYVFFNIHQITPMNAFIGTFTFGFPAGIMFFGWLQDVY